MMKKILVSLICSLLFLAGCEEDGYIVEPTIRTAKQTVIFKEYGTTRKDVYNYGYMDWDGSRYSFDQLSMNKLEFVNIKKGAKNLYLSNIDGNIEDISAGKEEIYLKYNGVYYLYHNRGDKTHPYYLFYEVGGKKYKRKIIYIREEL
jgi:hypothetical protein